MNELTVASIVKNGISIGTKNLVSLIAAVFLWIITLWIPYINVGTTIGMLSIVVAMSKGNVISPLEIFDGKYRQYMGEFFLVIGIIYIGTAIGYIFLVIPGIVITIAWSMAIYLLIDKEVNPMEAIKLSNKITYGYKWTIFFGLLLVSIVLLVVVGILGLIAESSDSWIYKLLIVIITIGYVPVILGAYAHIYGVLSQKA